MDHLRWRDGLASQPWVRFSVSNGGGAEHSHDFVEWFWVDSGRMRHRWDGQEEILEVGDVVLLHPRHRHGIVALEPGSAHVVVSVEPALFARVAARWRDHCVDWPFPAAHQPPTRRHLGTRALQRLRALVDLLPVRDQTPVDAELALAGTLRILGDQGDDAGLPPWLARAVAALDDPRRAAAGVSAFIAACGRSSATVCRACRRHLGCRPNDLVEGIRLDHAARLLRCTATPAAAIAATCGYASLSHFHRSFRRRFATTPAAYRLAN